MNGFINLTSRRTGRTTRMLDHAKQLSREGRAVYIIAASEREVKRLREMLGPGYPDIKIETSGSLPNFDWEFLTLRGAHPNCRVLIDHYAIEVRYARMLEMLHYYDLRRYL